MKLLQGKNNLFRSPSAEMLMLEISRFARPALCAPILNAGLGFFGVVLQGCACGLGDKSSTKADKGLLNMRSCSADA